MAPSCTNSASRSLPSRRPWTMTCATPSTASVSRLQSRAPVMPSSGSGPLSAHMSGSASFAFSALYTAYATSIRCVIPEYKVDLEKLIQLLLDDKRTNPSNYALVVLSEGATWDSYVAHERGEPDPYGHRRKASVAEVLADEIRRRTGEETMTSDLTYDLRSGDPDFTDKLVALTFGNMAFDAILDGKSGLMCALVDGCYDLVPIPDPTLGPRVVDVTSMYNTERYRPIYAHKRGLPIFLNRAS